MPFHSLHTLKSQGYRITQARAALINLLEQTSHPVTAQAISRILKKIGMSVNITTVYREIEFLLSHGIIETVPLVPHELHYELAGRPHHHHILCVTCGTIQDVRMDTEQELIHVAQHTTSYKIRSHTLTFYGVCPTCQ